jgi:hypothetical protein
MEDDLRRLLNEFLEETRSYRTEEVDLQLTNKMKPKKEWRTREASLIDLIDWLNGDISQDN